MAVFIPSDLFADQPMKSHNPLAAALPMLPHAPQNEPVAAQQENQKPVTSSANSQDSATVSPAPVVQPAESPYKPAEQIRFILSNPFQYLGILFNTLIKSGNLYLVSMVGLFGWIDTQVPDGLAYLILMILMILALLSPEPGIRIGIGNKLILSAIFLITFVLIETALYLYCNLVGSPQIIAVQGRYFIAISPLLFLLLYNNQLTGKIHRWLDDKPDHKKNKKGARKINLGSFHETEPPLLKVFPLMALIFGIITLIWSVFLILDRFYVLTL
jgi:hypothetical protein